MESLRCDICDSIAVELFSENPDLNEFQTTDNGVILSKNIKQDIIAKFYQNLNKEVSTENGFSDDFNGVINQIVCSYIKTLESQEISYFKPYLRTKKILITELEKIMANQDSVRLYKLPASVYIVGKGEEDYETEPEFLVI